MNHSVDLPEKFETYLFDQFNKKRRFNLKRQVRLLREHGKGRLELHRVESKAEAGAFLQAASVVAREAWQEAYSDEIVQNNVWWLEELEDLAERGLLRAYYMECAGTPCAYAFGYQFGDIYHYDQPGFAQSFAEYSPGSVLLFLLIEDLIKYRPVKTLSFGFGDMQYKRVFSNVHAEEVTVIMFKKSLSNKIRLACHRLYRAGRAFLRRKPRGRNLSE